MKKGFTLVELLAVVIVLAILATIAVTIIANVIGDARNSSNKISVENYLRSVEIAISGYSLEERINSNFCIIKKGDLYCDDTKLVVAEKNIPSEGVIALENGKIVNYYLIFDDVEYSYVADPKECFVSQYEGEINYYKYSNECPSHVIIPPNLKLPVSELVSKDFNVNKCIENSQYVEVDTELAKETCISTTNGGYTKFNEIMDNSSFWRIYSSFVETSTLNEYDFNYVFFSTYLKLLVYPFDFNYTVSDPTEYTITKIGNLGFFINKLDSVYIPGSIKTIGMSAFFADKISSIKLDDGVEKIEPIAFEINNLKKVELPESIDRLGWNSFSNNTLTEFNFSNNLTKLEKNVFEKNSFQSIEIPSNIQSIDELAFSENQNLTKIVFDNSSRTSNLTVANETFGTNIQSVVIKSSPNYINLTNSIMGWSLGNSCRMQTDGDLTTSSCITINN